MKALSAKTGKTLKPSPTQCVGGAARICFTDRRRVVMFVDGQEDEERAVVTDGKTMAKAVALNNLLFAARKCIARCSAYCLKNEVGVWPGDREDHMDVFFVSPAAVSPTIFRRHRR